MADSQLDRIEQAVAALTAKVNAASSKLNELLNLARTTLSQELLMANQIQDLAAQIDAATNLIAGKLDTEAQSLAAEATAITDLQARVQALIDAGQVTQAVSDQLASIRDRLGSAAATIDGSTATIAQQSTTLQGIARDPNNPVPTT